MVTSFLSTKLFPPELLAEIREKQECVLKDCAYRDTVYRIDGVKEVVSVTPNPDYYLGEKTIAVSEPINEIANRTLENTGNGYIYHVFSRTLTFKELAEEAHETAHQNR
ncbi:MAG: hypothetical protein ABEK59_07380 [Halobacteria archaeon]